MNVDILMLLDDWATIKANQALTYAGYPEGEHYATEAKRYRTAAAEITRLRAELAAANIYKPCQRKDTPHVPVKAVGQCNSVFWGIIESDEEFAERAGTQIQEVTE